MIIESVSLEDAALITMNPIKDERGHFMRVFCKKTLAEHGIDFDIVQSNTAFNHHANTLRGMHFQKPPFSESKMIFCIQGSLYDVIIDLRTNSKTFGQWYGVFLTAESHQALYIPKGFAHGYQTLEKNTTISYMVDEYYSPEYESGVHWDDPAFNIEWPNKDRLLISEKDKNWPFFDRKTDGLNI